MIMTHMLMGISVSSNNTGVGGPYGSLHVHLYKCVCLQMLEAGVGLCHYGYLNHLLESVSTCEFVSI